MLLILGCNPESITMNNTYKDKGTIKLTTNIYIIHADKGRMLAPRELANEFKIGNLRVEFEGTVEKDVSLPPNVEAIRLTSIKKII